MILGVKGPSNQHCIGGGGGMREFAVFLRKCPKTFGQDCRYLVPKPSESQQFHVFVLNKKMEETQKVSSFCSCLAFLFGKTLKLYEFVA